MFHEKRHGNTKLKSDHFGIETELFIGEIALSDILKSDHFGIETIGRNGGIRMENELKSDHFGIETNPP